MDKKTKKLRDVAVITGHPNDKIVIGPEDPPKKIQTEAAIQQLKSKLRAPEYKYISPTDRADIDSQNIDKQVKHLKKIVTKISTQPVIEEELNDIFAIVAEGVGSKLASLATSPIRAVGKAGQVAARGVEAAILMSHPDTAAITTGLVARHMVNKMASLGKLKSDDKEQLLKQYKQKTKEQQVALKNAQKQLKAQQRTKQPEQQRKEPEAQVTPPALRPVNLPPSGSSRSTAPKGPRSYTTGAGNLPSLNTASTVPPPGANLAFTPPQPSAPRQPAQQTTTSTQTPARSGRPQGGGKISGQLSQTPSAVRRRQQRAAKAGRVLTMGDWIREIDTAVKIEESLRNKAEKNEIDFDIVLEVFLRGCDSWTEDQDQDPEQLGMQRVNSFLAQGRNYFEEDSDLQEKTVVIGGKRYRQAGTGPSRAIYVRKLSKIAGHHTLFKGPDPITQQAMTKINRIKRKIRQANRLRLEDASIEEGDGLWANIHAKRARIKAGSGEKMRKPGSEGAPTKQNFIDASESISESFVVDRAAGYSGLYTAADLGIKIQGGFALHPSVVEEGGAINDNESKFHVTYDYYGSNREKPLYTKTIPVRAKSKEEAIHTVRKLVGGRNHRIETEGK